MAINFGNGETSYVVQRDDKLLREIRDEQRNTNELLQRISDMLERKAEVVNVTLNAPDGNAGDLVRKLHDMRAIENVCVM